MSSKDIRVQVTLHDPHWIGVGLIGLQKLQVHLTSSPTDYVDVTKEGTCTRVAHSVGPGREEEPLDGSLERLDTFLTGCNLFLSGSGFGRPYAVNLAVLHSSEPEVEARGLFDPDSSHLAELAKALVNERAEVEPRELKRAIRGVIETHGARCNSNRAVHFVKRDYFMFYLKSDK